MDLQVDLNTDGDLLVAVVRGTVSSYLIWPVMKQICDMALQKGLVRILVDTLGLQGVPTAIDRYTLGVKLIAYCTDHKFWPRLAVVGRPPVTDGFGVLVAKNRGLITERFLNRKEALEWVRAAPKCVA
jgi:hypothetical protein